MKNLGYALITLGFLAAALATMLVAEGAAWNLYSIGLGASVLGVAMARLATRQESREEGAVAENLGALRESLDRIVAGLADLNARRADVDVYDLRHEIDRLFLDDLETFAESRESLSHRYGLQAYADLMSHFAAGERYLNRVWCCSVDGYIDECHTYLDRAEGQFEEVSGRLGELSWG